MCVAMVYGQGSIHRLKVCTGGVIRKELRLRGLETHKCVSVKGNGVVVTRVAVMGRLMVRVWVMLRVTEGDVLMLGWCSTSREALG